MSTVQLINGDCLEAMRGMPECSVDAICCDPPGGISFMSKSWDSDRGGRTQWVAWLTDIMEEALRVTKPGGHAFVWALPRTNHWTAWALEDAGWEIRDVVHHIFGSGFPKSLSVSKAIDRMAGVQREVIGRKPNLPGLHRSRSTANHFTDDDWQGSDEAAMAITTPATEAAKQWAGFGTALKPAVENWILCRKPLSESSIARNVLKHGTGAINVDACRVSLTNYDHEEYIPNRVGYKNGINYSQPGINMGYSGSENKTPFQVIKPQGRWPSNLLLSHVPPDENGEGGCERVGVKRVRGTPKPYIRNTDGGYNVNAYSPANTEPAGTLSHNYADPDGFEEVESWVCQPNCPVKALGDQAGNTKSGKLGPQHTDRGKDKGTYGAYAGRKINKEFGGDQGSPARFFPNFEPDVGPGFKYQAKASKRERNKGLEGRPKKFLATMGDGVGQRHHNPDEPNAWSQNHHPTCKPVSLIKWLVTLVTPPGGTCLDPFLGSGTTGVACKELGFDFIGIEREADYMEIARARIAAAGEEEPTPSKTTTKPVEEHIEAHPNLFEHDSDEKLFA